MKKYDFLPDFIRTPLGKAKNKFNQIRQNYRQLLNLSKLSKSKTKKIIIGSSGTVLNDWVSTDREVLDLLDENKWQDCFQLNSLDAILAEHVWEHLNSKEGVMAADNCYQFLKVGGYLRIAVPDGFHPDPGYIDNVKPGGTGQGSDDHKVLYNYKTLSSALESVNFTVKLLEYFDENGIFHYTEWYPEDGMIRRSSRFDERNLSKPNAYTSLIVDAIKT